MAILKMSKTLRSLILYTHTHTSKLCLKKFGALCAPEFGRSTPLLSSSHLLWGSTGRGFNASKKELESAGCPIGSGMTGAYGRTSPIRHSGLDPESTGRGFNAPKYTQYTQSGRTLVETLATLGIVILLAVGVVKSYNFIVGRTKAQNTARMIKTLALERQNTAMSSTKRMRVRVKGPHSTLIVENGTPGNHSKYFWVETTLTDESFCEALKNSSLIQADLIEVNDVINGNCTDNSKLAFYFKKNTSSEENLTWVDGEGHVQKCPDGASACDDQGFATACEEGYYLTMGECARCGAHVATCEDESIPTTCQEGYELHWGECILPPQSCTTDLQCSVCGECDTETGYCQNECRVPKHECEEDSECGRNECVICSTSTHTCQYACERKEYLESTGTQYIDTGFIANGGMILETKANQIDGSFTIGSIGGKSQSPDATRNMIVFAVNSQGPGYDFEKLNVYGNVNNSVKYPTQPTDKTPHTFYFNTVGTSLIVKIDGQNFYSGTTAGTLANLTTSVYIGYSSYSATVRKGIYYYFKLWDSNDTLVRDFIPVSSPKGNCMFDRVTQKLFCNAATSGDDFRID